MKTNGYREEHRKQQRVSSRLVFIMAIGLVCIAVLYIVIHIGASQKNDYVLLRTNADVIDRTKEIITGKLYEEGAVFTFPDEEGYTINTSDNLYTVSAHFHTTSNYYMLSKDIADHTFIIKYCDGNNGDLRHLSITIDGTEYDTIYGNEIESVCI